MYICVVVQRHTLSEGDSPHWFGELGLVYLLFQRMIHNNIQVIIQCICILYIIVYVYIIIYIYIEYCVYIYVYIYILYIYNYIYIQLYNIYIYTYLFIVYIYIHCTYIYIYIDIHTFYDIHLQLVHHRTSTATHIIFMVPDSCHITQLWDVYFSDIWERPKHCPSWVT